MDGLFAAKHWPMRSDVAHKRTSFFCGTKAGVCVQ
jgi:hypothetical protein